MSAKVIAACRIAWALFWKTMLKMLCGFRSESMAKVAKAAVADDWKKEVDRLQASEVMCHLCSSYSCCILSLDTIWYHIHPFSKWSNREKPIEKQQKTLGWAPKSISWFCLGQRKGADLSENHAKNEHVDEDHALCKALTPNLTFWVSSWRASLVSALFKDFR